MKTFITTLLLLFSLSLFSQEGKIKRYKDENQKGKLIFVQGQWKPHGLWKSDYGTAQYENGKLQWIQLEGMERYTYNEIKIKQLESKLEKLEDLVSSK